MESLLRRELGDIDEVSFYDWMVSYDIVAGRLTFY
jgi:hypothetical protein